MIKITTIGWGNGQSNLLDAFYENLWENIEITSVVSMSDDGRTTGELMWAFNDELGLHLPPPGDLRRCLFSWQLPLSHEIVPLWVKSFKSIAAQTKQSYSRWFPFFVKDPLNSDISEQSPFIPIKRKHKSILEESKLHLQHVSSENHVVNS